MSRKSFLSITKLSLRRKALICDKGLLHWHGHLIDQESDECDFAQIAGLCDASAKLIESPGALDRGSAFLIMYLSSCPAIL